MQRIAGGLGRLLVPVLVLAAVACGNPSEPDPEPVPEGTLSATLSGSISEQYEATGSHPGAAVGEPETFAAARFNSFSGSFAVGGWRAREPRLQDALLIYFRDVTGAGTYAITDGMLNYGWTDDGPGRSFEITSGQVTLSAVSEDHLQGTFEAVAVEILGSPVDPDRDTVHLSDGSFGVPVVDF